MAEWRKSGPAALGTVGWAKLGPNPRVPALHLATPLGVSHFFLTAVGHIQSSATWHVSAAFAILILLAIQSNTCVHT